MGNWFSLESDPWKRQLEKAAFIYGYHRLHAAWFFSFTLEKKKRSSKIPPALCRVEIPFRPNVVGKKEV